MLVIRFFRVGKKKRPSFKIVVTDKKNPPQGGRFVDEIGSWNPITKDKSLDKEKIQKWLSQGAKPSPAVYNLFVDEGILTGAKLPVHKTKKKKEEAEEKPAEEVKKEEAPKEEKAEEKEAPKEEKKEEPKTEEKPQEEETESKDKEKASENKEEEVSQDKLEEKKEDPEKK